MAAQACTGVIMLGRRGGVGGDTGPSESVKATRKDKGKIHQLPFVSFIKSCNLIMSHNPFNHLASQITSQVIITF